jgi:hypothetical protein
VASKQSRPSKPSSSAPIVADHAIEHGPPELSNALLTELIAEALAQTGLAPDSPLLALSEQHWSGPQEGQVPRAHQRKPLPGLRSTHDPETTAIEDFEHGVAFLQGAGDAHAVDPNDVKQGSLGNCFFIAAMIAVARANPQAIQDLIRSNADGTFTVTLFIRPTAADRPKAVRIRVDAQLPVRRAGVPLYAGVGDANDESVELWPALIEKALAQLKGSYDAISGGNIGQDFVFRGATELLTGKPEGRHPVAGLTEDEALMLISRALEQGKPVVAGTRQLDDEAENRAATAVNVYGNHAYAPVSVDLARRTISLTNPWGSSHVTNLPIADFMKYYANIRVGG